MTIKKTLVIEQPEVGKLIREVRCLTRLTQEQLAANLGVTFSTINRWENGRAKPSRMAIRLIEGMLCDMGEQGKNLLAKYSSS